MKRNRALYLVFLLFLAVVTYMEGERLLYVALAVLAAMPVLSYAVTFFLLRFLQVTQHAPPSVVKNQPNEIKIWMHRVSPTFFYNITCKFYTDDFAVDIREGVTMWLGGGDSNVKASATQDIPFTVKYRGMFNIGLESIQVSDLMGMFRLKRRIRRKLSLTSYPRIVELSSFPLATHLLTQAHSRFDIRDEDYATISDIRPYLPTDSIKRVHWKLTAKRNEWLVKNFQSNALNKVTMVFDTLRLNLRYREQLILEDRMMEMAMGLARFCLAHGMPVEFMTGEGHSVESHNVASFETIYHVGSDLAFNKSPAFSPAAMLSHFLNDASGYLNMMVFTTRLDSDFYERLINGKNNGHYIAVLYFSTIIRDGESEEIYAMLSEGGAPVYRIDDNSLTEIKEETTHV
jgi:uncharacterized protein (DUF58 family)